MPEENQKTIEDEVLEEEYMLGKEYYNHILEKAKEENKQKYK